MGACSGSEKEMSTERSEALARELSKTLPPIEMAPRRVDRTRWLEQRARTLDLWHRGDADGRRMSRLRASTMDLIISKITSTSKKSDTSGLDDRLETFGMKAVSMEGDGNCQFRSMAFNLFGSQEHHAISRKAAVAHMQKHEDFFGTFFENEDEFRSYLQEMATPRTWGDELTLRAVVEAYACVAHVLTSEQENWYLVYQPEEQTPDPAVAFVPKGHRLPRKRKQIFLAYISPIHYNALVAK
mmetsp:Transcript_65811/g.174487  ORF Transcript_65811/g.174487 Transcript_65811/m.174487 type:complete len:242 (-) Transcript_65811:75-800(-)